MKQNKQKKNKGRRRGKERGTSGFLTIPSLFPDKWVGTMAFSCSYTFSPAANAVATNVFRLNSVFDPDFTGVGTSAAGYGNAAGLYGRYRVLSAKIDLSYSPVATGMTVYAVASPATSLGVGIADITAQRNVWFHNMGGGGPGVMKQLKATTWKIYGATPQAVLAEDDYCGLVGGNPNNGTFLHVGCYNPSAAAASMMVTVRILYNVEWSLPVKISQ